MMQALSVNATASLADLIKAPEAVSLSKEPSREASFSELVKEADSRLRADEAVPSAQQMPLVEADEESVVVQEQDETEEDIILATAPQLALYADSAAVVQDQTGDTQRAALPILQEIDFSDETVLSDIPLAALDLPVDAEEFLAAVQEAAPEALVQAQLPNDEPIARASSVAQEDMQPVLQNESKNTSTAIAGLYDVAESTAPVLAAAPQEAEAEKASSIAQLAAHENKKGAKLTVVDQRQDFSSINKAQTDSAQLSKAEQKAAAKGELVLDIKQSSGNTAQMELSLGQSAANAAAQNMTASSDQAASATGSQFQAMLANQIQANAPEFVRAGNIVLKDGNMGTINLIMHPESLGNVKISLEVSDKVIAGQITVASREAYNAFRESIGALQNAFTENGFESIPFEPMMEDMQK